VSNAIVYNSDGKIIYTMTIPEAMLHMQVKDPGETLILGTADMNTQYISFGEITDRPIQPTAISGLSLSADGVDHLTLTGVPLGTFSARNTLTGETVSGPISSTDTFSTTVSGFYLLSVVAWPYLNFEVTVHAI
jgi:hypothetical protein